MADGAFKQVHQGVYGQGISPEDGLDQPRYDTSQLAERIGCRPPRGVDTRRPWNGRIWR
jgi:hypothetical protein